MDPNENLQEQEECLDALTMLDLAVEINEQLERLTELRQALYDWIRDGGFEPDWSKAPNAAEHYGH